MIEVKEEFFLIINIPIVVYMLQIEHLFRIFSIIYKEVYVIIKRKLNTEVYNLLYRLRQFCIIKKDKKSIQIIHSLESLNRATIVHSGLLPTTKEMAIYFVEKIYNKILDLICRV